MSRSNKPTHGMRCKAWKDTVRRSRCQAQAHAKRKRWLSRQELREKAAKRADTDR